MHYKKFQSATQYYYQTLVFSIFSKVEVDLKDDEFEGKSGQHNLPSDPSQNPSGVPRFSDMAVRSKNNFNSTFAHQNFWNALELKGLKTNKCLFKVTFWFKSHNESVQWKMSILTLLIRTLNDSLKFAISFLKKVHF